MATGWSTVQENVLCRYFMHGACKEGSNCSFSHDRSHQPSLVCRYYAAGHCSYGRECRYDHCRPNRNSQPNRHQQTARLDVKKSTNHVQTPFSQRQESQVDTAAAMTAPPAPLYSFSVTPTCPYLAARHVAQQSGNFSHQNCQYPNSSSSENNSQVSQASTSDGPSINPSTSYHRHRNHSVNSNMTVLSNKRAGTSYSHPNSNPTSSVATTSRANETGNVESTSNTNSSTKADNGPKATQVTSANTTNKGRSVGETPVNNKSSSLVASNSAAGKKKLGPVQLPASSWADAPEFVPRNLQPPPVKEVMSWANVVGGANDASNSSSMTGSSTTITGFIPGGSPSDLCPFFMIHLTCHLMDQCPYIHGQVCDLCQLACLDPRNPEQRKEHAKECANVIEADMEHSFAVARSQDKQCGICMDTVMERSLPSQRRFGILPNCSHIFCLDCIRKWRQSKQFENKIIRSCPECRIQSDYIVPSRYWVDESDKEEKKKLVDSYRDALGKKECKYFNKGEGTCPFGNKCFYRHALADGTIKDVGPPRRRRKFGADGELHDHLESMVLWDFMDEREHRLELLRGSIQSLLLELELEDIADTFYISSMSDSDSDL
ncbi:probable E3 ubiquitin-protein ligase makorin-1 [Hyalella azteca]|uniref:RING-type E3 ubiquitin transferase n=1 Tax=Hyalella azteca TaxID=294128 RepID=A0A8B7NDP4_HYAAZ|nr:probable E3 ubiquitin-protein ligase makorin-1 [Hyalella azteca]